MESTLFGITAKSYAQTEKSLTRSVCVYRATPWSWYEMKVRKNQERGYPKVNSLMDTLSVKLRVQNGPDNDTRFEIHHEMDRITD